MSASSMIKGETPEEAALIDRLIRAGVFFYEVRRDPEHRLLITVAVAPKSSKPAPASEAQSQLEGLRAELDRRSGR
jgi:hypothetical protein